jgi:type II secretory pathway component GspD/PulD (secretin)
MFVNMRDGETIAIGGLILEQDRNSVSGIPILKDLPIIGRLLFSRTTTSRDRTEIVFFLTAKIVDEGNRSNAASPRTSENTLPDPLGTYRQTGGNNP